MAVDGIKLVSGGQTGADRAASDFALAQGGWCPKGRKAEDRPIDRRYELAETPRTDYLQRTEWNVRDSEGTVTFAPLLTGGSTVKIGSILIGCALAFVEAAVKDILIVFGLLRILTAHPPASCGHSTPASLKPHPVSRWICSNATWARVVLGSTSTCRMTAWRDLKRS